MHIEVYGKICKKFQGKFWQLIILLTCIHKNANNMYSGVHVSLPNGWAT